VITGIGCDIVAIARFRKDAEKLAQRILTHDEAELYAKLSETRKPEWLAGRFAAKEAIAKALGQVKVITQISVLSNEEGKPTCTIAGYSILVSISHEKEYAIAYAIVQNI
jgi:holo-[acyl-carrier protein] synthase